jgi:LacI family transcriptional regulator
MKSRVTIREVAKLAEVSSATVSAVINGNKYVSPTLANRVEQAIAKLDYRPNWVARSLKIRATKTIGLVFTNITSAVWPPLVRSVQKTAQQAGFDTFLIPTDEDERREKTSLNYLLSKRVDGIIITPAFSNDYKHKHLLESSQFVPIVALERKIPGIESVITNNEEISYKAVSHLIDHGYKRIGLVTIPSLGSNIADRISGYCKALKDSGLYDSKLIRERRLSDDTVYYLALDLLSNTKVDAVFTTSQSTALKTLQAAKKLGRHIPEDLAIFGYDYMDWMEVLNCPISTVRQPIQEMARLATEFLIERLNGHKIPVTTHILESSLVIRQSCGCNQSFS